MKSLTLPIRGLLISILLSSLVCADSVRANSVDTLILIKRHGLSPDEVSIVQTTSNPDSKTVTHLISKSGDWVIDINDNYTCEASVHSALTGTYLSFNSSQNVYSQSGDITAVSLLKTL